MNTDQLELDIHEIKKDSPAYPGRMKSLSNMPDTLYYTGKLPSDGRPACAIIGARLCSPYGREAAYSFARILSKEGVQIISGMAVGIDGYAQEGALDAGGDTFAVLGSGVDICYPRSNGSIYRRLLQNGGILSELPPGTPPLSYHFPSRNRIISALADIVLVVEAKARSGSLITVDFALSQGKPVYAVPGRVGDHLSDGCNSLIADGAGIAYAPEAILKELHLLEETRCQSRRTGKKTSGRRKALQTALSDVHLTDDGRKVLALLPCDESVTADTLMDRSSLPIPRILSALTLLIQAGYAEETTRGSFKRSAALRNGEDAAVSSLKTADEGFS